MKLLSVWMLAGTLFAASGALATGTGPTNPQPPRQAPLDDGPRGEERQRPERTLPATQPGERLESPVGEGRERTREQRRDREPEPAGDR